ncbi:DUF5642 family protein [Mycobacteroides chelonae]|nr:DUF5642 family protein [Mycobacteroides chelonae]
MMTPKRSCNFTLLLVFTTILSACGGQAVSPDIESRPPLTKLYGIESAIPQGYAISKSPPSKATTESLAESYSGYEDLSFTPGDCNPALLNADIPLDMESVRLEAKGLKEGAAVTVVYAETATSSYLEKISQRKTCKVYSYENKTVSGLVIREDPLEINGIAASREKSRITVTREGQKYTFWEHVYSAQMSDHRVLILTYDEADDGGNKTLSLKGAEDLFAKAVQLVRE